MPKLKLSELRRVPKIFDSSYSYQSHGILSTIVPRHSLSNLQAHTIGADSQLRTFTSAHRRYQSKLYSNITKLVSSYTTMISSDVPASEGPPPTGPMAIVFTDIVKSTDIWEKDTNAMITAMQLHDDTIRSFTRSNNGYEVKQNGDGFMIAFPTAISAVRFCLDVQEKLLDEQWPKELLKMDPGEETTDDSGQVLFRGLQLRTSAHWGEPVSKWNEVIHRMDYLGPIVNRAARFVQVTEAGQTVVSEDFVSQVQHEMQANTGNKELSPATSTDSSSATDTTTSAETSSPTPPDLDILRSRRNQENITDQHFEVRELGDYEFQGLDEPQKLYFIVPRSLEGRVEHWHQVKHVSGVKGNVKTG